MGTDDSDEIDWQVLSVKVQPDLHERIQQHKESQGHSTNSETVRDLMRGGLESTGKLGATTREIGVLWVATILIFINVEWNFQVINTDWLAVLGFGLLAGLGVYSYVKD